MAVNKELNKEKIETLLSRNVEEAIDESHLRAALLSGKKLRVKFGIDPTGDKIHIGRAVALWKLKEFQDLGAHDRSHHRRLYRAGWGSVG